MATCQGEWELWIQTCWALLKKKIDLLSHSVVAEGLVMYAQLYSNYSYSIIIIIWWHTLIWFQVFQSNTNNFQTNLFDP